QPRITRITPSGRVKNRLMRPLGVIRVIRGWFVFVLLPKGSGNIAEDVFDGLTAYAEANKTIADRVAAPAGSPLCSGVDATETRRQRCERAMCKPHLHRSRNRAVLSAPGT